MKKQIFISLLFFILFTSCKNNSATTENKSQTNINKEWQDLIIPDSFVPLAYVSPQTMLERREAAKKAVAKVPERVSVSADTPLLPLLAQREELIRFPNSVQFKDRQGAVRSVDYIVTFPGYYTPLAPVFKGERRVQIKIREQVRELLAQGDYTLIHCEAGALVLRRAPDKVPGQKTTPGISSHCDALD